MSTFLTGVKLVRKTLAVRQKFEQLVDVKVQGFNREYEGKRPPLQRPTTRYVDQLIGCLISPVTSFTGLCNASIPIPSVPKTEFGKSLLGLVIGLLISWFYYWLLVSVMRVKRSAAVVTAVTVLFVLSLGLAFTQRMRLLCLVSLATICSSTGRAIVFAFILLLVYRGPLANLTENGMQLGKGIACAAHEAQQAAKQEVKKLMDHLQPVTDFYKKLNQTVNRFIDKVEEKARRVRQTAKMLKDSIKDLDYLKDVIPDSWSTHWLLKYNVAYQISRKLVKLALSHFMPDFFEAQWLLLQAKLQRQADLLAEKLAHEANRTIEPFRVNIIVKRDFIHSSTSSKNWSQVLTDFTSDLESEVRWMKGVFNFLRIFHPILTFLVLIRALLYIRSYGKKLHFDNCYITSRVCKIDAKRAIVPNCPTILPLTPLESLRYMDPLSLRLTEFERRKLFLGLVFIASYVALTAFYMLADWSLYQSVVLVARHRHDVDIQVQAPKCEFGDGDSGQLFADIYKPIGDVCGAAADAPDFLNSNKTKETLKQMTDCFPTPSEPDYETYKRIGLLLLLCLITTLAEAYTLRLRHAACDLFFPERADQRAGWLYNTILASRGSFSDFVADQFKARLGFVGVERVSLVDRLAATVPCFRLLFQSSDPVFCSKCAKKGSKEEDEWHLCDSCRVSHYCPRCLSLLNNVCSSCQEAILVPDSDLSVEQDSDDEDWQEEDFNLPPDVLVMRKKMQRLGLHFARTGVTRDPATEAWEEEEAASDSEGERTRPAEELERETGVPDSELEQMSQQARAFLR